ncbi:MAG: toprim domain-containing protein [Thaumarchaeota archaeon]|nr:toprim domain-containing protein [Nitrososphaerota archaeon]
MDLDESEIDEVHEFIKSLNSRKDSIVVVEGKRDKEALEKLGFTGNICQFHSFQGLMKFVDCAMEYKNLIVLLDSDRKGAYLTKRIISQLGHRMSVDLSFRRKLTTITKGKARHIEDLFSYCGTS